MHDSSMTWLSFEEYVLRDARAEVDPTQLERVAPGEALFVIGRALRDAGSQRALLRLWSDARPGAHGAPRHDVLARSWVEAMLLRPGAPLILWRRRPARSNAPLSPYAPPPQRPPEEPPPTEGFTLELEVLYQDGDCAVGLPYKIEGPSGPIEGKLNRHGYAFHNPVDGGSYRAVFGGSDDVPPVEPKGWVDFELTDAAGLPMAGAEYELKLSSGETLKGALDQNGRLSLSGIAQGDHELTFPGIDVSSLAE